MPDEPPANFGTKFTKAGTTVFPLPDPKVTLPPIRYVCETCGGPLTRVSVRWFNKPKAFYRHTGNQWQKQKVRCRKIAPVETI